jgi:hypothetical protein
MNMAYELSGDFYEACDCEVICSCWAGVNPDMGACTGLWVWHANRAATQLVEGKAADGIKVMVLNNGKSCDDSDHALVLVDVGASAVTVAQVWTALTAAGPWGAILSLAGRPLTSVAYQAATITIAQTAPPAPAGVSISAVPQGGGSVIANCEFPPSTSQPVAAKQCQAVLTDTLGSSLVARSVGSDPRTVEIGQIVRDPGEMNGLNMLVASNATDGYIFDLDITGMTAMKGKFHYVG